MSVFVIGAGQRQLTQRDTVKTAEIDIKSSGENPMVRPELFIFYFCAYNSAVMIL